MKAKKIYLDSHIWDEFRRGNDSSFKEIYQIHIGSLMHYGVKFTKDRELVKDCIHDMFVDLYNNRTTLGPTNKIKPYLFTSLKRKLIRTLQSQDKYVLLHTEELPFFVDYSFEKDIIDKESEQMNKDILQNSLNKLTFRQKEAIYLRFTEGLNYEEISEVLELNYQSARNLIHRAILQLREFFSKSDINLLNRE